VARRCLTMGGSRAGSPRCRPPYPRSLLIAVIAAITVIAALCGLVFPVATARAGGESLRIGSKRFTESYILAEIAAAAARAAGATVTHQQGLGGTALVYRALEEGSIDVYPDYTGTIAEAILHRPGAADLATIRQALAPHGIGVSDPLGFEDRYALAVPAELAAKLGLRTLSDLAAHPELRLGLSPEFLGRSDGFPGLAARYGLSRERVQQLDHGLAYEAITRGSIDVTDAYTTDAKLARYHLVVLEDDRRFFPSYQAVYLYREDAARRAPRALAAVLALAGSIDARAMIDLNAQAELEGRTFASVAEGFWWARTREGAPAVVERRQSLLRGLFATVRAEGPRHVGLVAVSLFFAVLLGVPLGIAAARAPRFGRGLLAATGVVQTIPSLALLCFLIPLLGTGTLPALVALFLYGLLPIARNTAAGIEGIPPPLAESAAALGLSSWARLFRVELPLASRTILAGIKTSAVINVGTATLAAFIGAGGFGAPISTGLNLNDTDLILEGAIPAALLALAVEGLFSLLDRALIPRGLRLSEAFHDGAASGPPADASP
jgi:osmoprotectant transport system permease protein